MSDSVWPHRRQPTRLSRLWDSPGKNTGVGCHFLLQCTKVKSESEVALSCPTLCYPMDCSPQAPPPMGFPRQEYWSGVPLPSPRSKLEFIYFYFLKVFNWRIIASQCCVSFCCTAKWISPMSTYILFFWFPSRLGHCRALNRVPCAT